MQGIFQKENTDKVLKYGIYRHLPTYEKIIRNLVSFYSKNIIILLIISLVNWIAFMVLPVVTTVEENAKKLLNSKG